MTGFWVRTAAALGVAAATAATVAMLPAEQQGPEIVLVDNTGALTPLDTWDPAIGNLEPALLTALQAAAADARAQGIAITVTSGWRSPAFQQQLLDDAILSYGSYPAARRYVQTPEQSHHVTGRAVDIAGADAQQWLISNGARYGLCRIYANEMWHFELATDPAGQCPPLLPDAGAPG